MTGKLKVKFAVDDGGLSLDNIAVGRDAWALLESVRAGDSGCTPIKTSGPRWSDTDGRNYRRANGMAHISESIGRVLVATGAEIASKDCRAVWVCELPLRRGK